MIVAHDVYEWNPPDGPGVRAGDAVITHSGTFYDGGFSSEGIFNIVPPTVLFIDGSAADSPDAVWTATRDQAAWIDQGSVFASMNAFMI